MDNSFGLMTEMVLDIYYSSTQRNRIKLEVEYVNDLYSRRLELAYNEKEKDEIIKVKSFSEGINGTMVMPEYRDGIHYIVISKTALNERLQFISTIIHELTHIHDFIDFAAEFCDGNYKLIGGHASFGFFYYWTEFNARRNGYLYSRNILNIEEDFDYILNTELLFHYDYLLNNLRKYRYGIPVNYVYYVIQYMGRFSIWEDMFPDKITPYKYLPDYLQNHYGPKIIELYDTLHSMVNFDIAEEKEIELKN